MTDLSDIQSDVSESSTQHQELESLHDKQPPSSASTAHSNALNIESLIKDIGRQ